MADMICELHHENFFVIMKTQVCSKKTFEKTWEAKSVFLDICELFTRSANWVSL